MSDNGRLPIVGTGYREENGYAVFEDGRRVKLPKDPYRTNDQTPSVGTPADGQGSAGKNIFRAQAIEHIVGQRGKGGGSNPNAWDEGDIGWWGRSQGVTVQDLQNLEHTRNLPLLESQFNSQLAEAGVTNADGTPRTVQWGDTEDSLKEILARQARSTADRDQFDTDVQTIQNDLITQNNAATTYNADRTNTENDAAEARSERETEGERSRAFELGMKQLDNKAETARYEQELAQWERQNRRDSLGALIAGLATLGAGFAI